MAELTKYRKGWEGNSVGAGTTDEWMKYNAKDFILPDIRYIEGESYARFSPIPHYVALEPFTFSVSSGCIVDEHIAPDADGLYNFTCTELLTTHDEGNFGNVYAADGEATYTLSGIPLNWSPGTLNNRNTETPRMIEFKGMKYSEDFDGDEGHDIDIPEEKYNYKGVPMLRQSS